MDSEENEIANKIFCDIGKITNLKGLQNYHVMIMIEKLSDLTRTAMEKELGIVAQTGLSGFSSVVRYTIKEVFIWEAVRMEISELQSIVEIAVRNNLSEVARGGIMSLKFIAESLLKHYDRIRVKNAIEYEFDAVKDISCFLKRIGETVSVDGLSRLARDLLEEIDSNISKKAAE